MIHFKDNKNKSALSTRWAQMTKQEQIIERKKMEIQAKLEAQKQAAALAAQAKLTNPSPADDKGSANIFSNDGSFMSQFKALLEKQKQDKIEQEKSHSDDERQGSEQQYEEEYEEHFVENDDRRPSDGQRKRQNRWNDRDRHRPHSPIPPIKEERKKSLDNKHLIPSLMHIPIMQPSSQNDDNEHWLPSKSDDDSEPGVDNLMGPSHMGSGPMGPGLMGPGPMGPGSLMGPGPMPPGMGPGLLPHGPGMGLGMGPGPNMGPDPNMGPGQNMSMGHGPGSGMGPRPGLGHGPGMGLNQSGPGMGVGPNPVSNMAPRPGSGMGSGPMSSGPNMGSSSNMGGPNMGSSSGPNMPSGSNLPQGMGPGTNMPPGMGPAANMPPGMGPGSNMPPGMGLGPNMPPGMGVGPNMPPGMGPGPNMPPGMGPGPNMPPGMRPGPNMPPGMGPGPGMNPGPMMGPRGPHGGPMPPFMGGPSNYPMPPNFMGPNGPCGPMPPNMCGPSGPNGPMPPFFGPPFSMSPNGPPPNSMMPPNSMGNNMPFMPRPPFGPNGPPNFGNGPPMPPFMQIPDNKPLNNSSMPPDSMSVPMLSMRNEMDSSNSKQQVFSADSLPPSVHRAADEVARNGDHWENVLKAIHSQDQNLWFLHNTNSNEYKAFRELVNKIKSADRKPEIKPEDKYEPEFSLEDDESNDDVYGCIKTEYNDRSYGNNSQFGLKREQASSQSDEESEGKRERRKKKKSRWSDDPPAADIKPPGLVAPMPSILPAGAALAKIDEEGLRLSNVNRNNHALMQYAMTNYGTTNLSGEDWKKCEDNFKLNLLYQDMLKKRQEVERLAAAGKHKYEYDSDEDTAEGTWEHKLRAKEMNATEKWATELTKQAAGKHHIGDFLPPEELKKFMEKYSAVKSGKEPDLSDYKEFKLKEDNVGFKMLQKLGWSEGQGLGAEGGGIVEPINKGNQPMSNLGLGASPSDNVNPDDDEFDAYRKRMMLAYRFRPNPLNNPRRPYY